MIVNGVGLTLKLWPSKNAFHLMSSDEGAAYAVQIMHASFKLCLQKPNAGVLMNNSKLLAKRDGHVSVRQYVLQDRFPV